MSAKRLSGIDLSLYLVADVDFAAGRDLVRLVRESVRGGVTAVQLRAKGLGTREFLKLAIRMADVLKGRSIPFIINDRVDIALACGAEGVHLGQDDMTADIARKLLGPMRIIGISVNTMKEARAAERLGADYLGLNPIYETTTKDTGLPALGPSGVVRMHERIGIPIIAIGGINIGNAADIMRSGAAGIAVVSAILGAPDARNAAAELKKVLSAYLPRRGKLASSGGMSPSPSKAFSKARLN
jgi:thiamine-phosphate pyrophosphorylase